MEPPSPDVLASVSGCGVPVALLELHAAMPTPLSATVTPVTNIQARVFFFMMYLVLPKSAEDVWREKSASSNGERIAHGKFPSRHGAALSAFQTGFCADFYSASALLSKTELAPTSLSVMVPVLPLPMTIGRLLGGLFGPFGIAARCWQGER